MSWNYRVVEVKPKHFELREVYYADDGETYGWTKEAAVPFGESLEELTEDLRYMMLALTQPVLALVPEVGEVLQEKKT